MIKNTVQNHPYPVLLALCNEHCKILFRSQHRVNLHIVAGIIPMIGIGAKYRVQIQYRNMQCLQIAEFLDDPSEIPPEKVIIEHLSVFICAKFGPFVPILIQPLPLPDTDAAAASETVRKNLIHDSALEPVRRNKIFPVDKNLIRRRSLGKTERPVSAHAHTPAADPEPVKIQPGFRERKLYFPSAENILHMQRLSLASVLLQDECTRLIAFAIYLNRQRSVLPYPSAHAFTGSVQGIIIDIHAAIIL